MLRVHVPTTSTDPVAVPVQGEGCRSAGTRSAGVGAPRSSPARIIGVHRRDPLEVMT